LSELCKQCQLNFSIAHCNFQLRGEESRRDEDFVRLLGKKYEVRVFVERFETEVYTKTEKLSVQEAARKLRYDFFYRLKKENNFSWILLAHHADDNIETLLMNFFRGTGLQGMKGMPLSNDQLLRPMLEFRRTEILSFAEEQGLDWVEDSSNASSKYTRNFFRNELIPEIKKVYPEVEQNLLGNIRRFTDISDFYQKAIAKAKSDLFQQNGNEIRIPVLQLLKYGETVIYEIIKDFGFGEKQVAEVIKLIDSGSGKFIENEQYQIIRHRNWLIISPKNQSAETFIIESQDEKLNFSGGSISIREIPVEKFNLDTSSSVAQLDARHIEFPLLMRRWKQGDYFYPLGMPKKKKLARFFIDSRLSKNQKENIWVLESNKRIVWVVGHRIDDRCKIIPSTKSIIKITYQNKVI
jgi:tRNA(Ile)-lysidine synthase